MNSPSTTEWAADGSTRRDFLVRSGAGGAALVLGWQVPSSAVAQAAGSELNLWVVVHPDERCIVRIARSEMGQGTLTGLAQLVAEELECDWSKVGTEQVSAQRNHAAKRAWGEMGTGGSRGIRTSHDFVRRGGAAARVMLLQAAANEWGVPVAELQVASGVITHAASARRTTYGRVAAAAARLTPPDAKALVLKDPRSWTVAGQPKARLDSGDKLDGSKTYAIAQRLQEGLDAATAYAGRNEGDALQAIATAAKQVEATYGTPFLAHATMEPMNCTARFSADKAECWVATQNAEAAHAALSESSGLPLAQCEVNRLDLGGGFGRRGGLQDYVRQAVAIARQFAGTPVQMIWSREEDQAQDFYR